MIHKTGDIFTTDAKYIAHGVNTVGLMGAGIARQFKERFPVNYKLYKSWCFSGDLLPGGAMGTRQIHNGNEIVVLNLASQQQPGANAKYSLLFSSLDSAAAQVAQTERIEKYGNRIAIPEIGCGIGGLNWNIVEKILESIEHIYDVEFEVWHYGV